mmetsp:Transcript_79702/g.165582  ORF Transcript_79702/g.165582 Transcript_79702/m.165582 type:complete len:220 (+) Transcript_79702:496-1155(+)
MFRNMWASGAIFRLVFHWSKMPMNFSSCSCFNDLTHLAMLAWAGGSGSFISAPSSASSLLLTMFRAYVERICLICPGRSSSKAKLNACSIFPSFASKPILVSLAAISASSLWSTLACSSDVSRQMQSFESDPPDTILSPMMSTHQTLPSCSSKLAAQSAVLICQSFTSPSAPPVINCMPLPKKATFSTAPVWPWKDRIAVKSFKFHSRAVPSPEAEAMT